MLSPKVTTDIQTTVMIIDCTVERMHSAVSYHRVQSITITVEALSVTVTVEMMHSAVSYHRVQSITITVEALSVAATVHPFNSGGN